VTNLGFFRDISAETMQIKRKSKNPPARDGATQARAAVALGKKLMAADVPSAIAQFQHAVSLDPHSGSARYALGCAWLEAGDAERAAEIFSQLSESHPRFAARAAGKIAQAEAMQQENRLPASYVRHLFDQFATDYDRRMVEELSYSAPAILRGLADMLVAAAPGTLDILDLGCGTGLAGRSFLDLARRLDGVDLSPAMVEHARGLKIYNDLVVADVENLLIRKGRSYDLILAADVLVYLGDLTAVFRGAASRLKPGGFLFCTLEKEAGTGFELGPKRRYRHSPSYVTEEAARAGLDVMGLLECVPRQDAGAPVKGLAAALQRASREFGL
jgi:predicted TPR repeat methyltransferase